MNFNVKMKEKRNWWTKSFIYGHLSILVLMPGKRIKQADTVSAEGVPFSLWRAPKSSQLQGWRTDFDSYVVICVSWMIPIEVTPSIRSSNILNKCVSRVLWSIFSAYLPMCNTILSFIHFISLHSFLHNTCRHYSGLEQTRNKPENSLRYQLLDSACDRLTCFRGRGCIVSWWQYFFPSAS